MVAAHCVSADNTLGAIIVDIRTTPIVATYYDYVNAELKHISLSIYERKIIKVIRNLRWVLRLTTRNLVI